MQRPHWYFDCKGHKEGKENQDLLNNIQRSVMPGLNIKGIGCVIQVEHRDQSKKRAKQGVKEELKRGINTVLATPYADDDVHRY